MIITIAAMTKNRVIGKGMQLPWHIPEDLELFNKLTTSHAVLMGYNTYKSIGHALPNRENFVLSYNIKELPDARVHSAFVGGLLTAKEWAKNHHKDVFIIGGSSLYTKGLKYSNKLYLSHIKKEYEGDIFFPEINWDEWEIEKEKEYEEFIFRSYARK